LDDEVAEPELDLGETEQILSTLDPIDREIVVMKAVLEYSLEEIATQLSLKLSATKMRYYRALDKLKAEITHGH
jgi:RNA polymerase sigma-70 factor (ECF subfamily)